MNYDTSSWKTPLPLERMVIAADGTMYCRKRATAIVDKQTNQFIRWGESSLGYTSSYNTDTERLTIVWRLVPVVPVA